MNIAIIIAPENYQDKEFEIPKNIFLKHNISVEVFSTKKGIAQGKLGGSFNVFHDLSEINCKNFNALFIVGGPGAIIVRSDPRINNVINEFDKSNKLIGAICIAPTILAKSGVLNSKKATVWLGTDPELNTPTNKILEQYGAKFVNQAVVYDHNIITGNGPLAAEEFGIEFVKILQKHK